MPKAAPFGLYARVIYRGPTIIKGNRQLTSGDEGIVLRNIAPDPGTGAPIDEDPEIIDRGRDGRSVVDFPCGISRVVDQAAVDAGRYEVVKF